MSSLSGSDDRHTRLTVYLVPPPIIGDGVRLYGYSLFQLFAFIFSSFASLFFLFFIPIGIISLRVVITVIFWCGIAGFFLLPIPSLTPFELLIIYLGYWKSKIPKRTRARVLTTRQTRYR
ncbi:MAG: hypothetical protein WCS37_03275 [Chloroflexota bacterium]|nr:hypothetical protein [Chloroflexota bacterium]